MSGLNICFLVYDFSQSGGAERMVSKLANELSSDYKIHVVSVFKFNETNAYNLQPNIDLSYIFYGKGHISNKIIPIIRKLRHILKTNSIDYLICVDVSTALIGFFSTLLSKRKMITWDHSSAYNRDLFSKFALRIYGWFGLHFSKYYVTLTEASREKYIIDHRFVRNKLIVIPNWVEDDVCKSNVYDFDKKTILTVGRADTVKGYENLIKVAKEVLKSNVDWKWHIWGNFETEYGKHILQLIYDEGLNDKLIYKGVSKSIYNIYSQYSFYVLTSYYEGLPMVILEAQMNNLPIVAFDCMTGPREMIKDGVNGILIKCYDIDMMIKEINYLISNKNKAIEMSNNSRINMYKFEKQSIIELWKKILI